MIVAPTYLLSFSAICSMFSCAGFVFKQNIIYLFLLRAIGWIRCREEKRREEIQDYNYLFPKSIPSLTSIVAKIQFPGKFIFQQKAFFDLPIQKELLF